MRVIIEDSAIADIDEFCLSSGRKTASKCLVAVSLLSIAGWSVANRRGLELLKANLTTAQLNDFMTYRRFDVVGGVSGRVYRIRYAGTMNVKELDRNGRCVRRLCFYPEGLVHGDIVLAQKAALEAFETETLAIANKYPPLLGRA